MLSKEIVKVYTKYDVIPNRIIRNEERKLTLNEWWLGVASWEAKCYDAVLPIEKGLEGVTFVRYAVRGDK